MLLGENVNGKAIYNGYNHNEHGDPHAQYDKFRTWTTKTITTGGEKWVNIFKGTFQKNPDALSKNERAFHRLIYSFILYNMNNDSTQDVQLVTFLVQVTNNGEINAGVETRQLYGDPCNMKIFYKETDLTNKIYDVQLYVKSTQAYTKYKILPIIYDPINNYDCPMHLEASFQGINTKDKLDILYKNLISNEWKSIDVVKSELTGYTEITSLGDIGNIKVKGQSIVSNTPRIRFKDLGEAQLGTQFIDVNNKTFKFETSSNITKYGFDKTISPSQTNVDLGYNDYRFNVGYFHKANIKIYNSYAELPTTNNTGDLVIYKNPSNNNLSLLIWEGTTWKALTFDAITF